MKKVIIILAMLCFVISGCGKVKCYNCYDGARFCSDGDKGDYDQAARNGYHDSNGQAIPCYEEQ